jgi:hypothetical protein
LTCSARSAVPAVRAISAIACSSTLESSPPDKATQKRACSQAPSIAASEAARRRASKAMPATP